MAKRVLIGVSGSIAAYKIADVVSDLVKRGHDVQCILTDSAANFVSPLVLETLSHHPVRTQLFGPDVSGTEHIELARWADLFVVAPATANILAKLALGLADDLLTTVALATEAPVLVAPAMNTVMYLKPVTQGHMATLASRGVAFVDPASGTLACGEVGIGKLASPAQIVAAIEAALGAAPVQDLVGLHVLITAGPTTTPIDAVRYITNHSTGRMGAAMAEEALSRGAHVHYVLGTDKGVVRPVPPPGAEGRLKLVEVRTAEEMATAALAELPQVKGVIATAAVMDYRVETPATGKLKRAAEQVTLALVPSVDVLGTLRQAATGQWFLGFAAETDDVAANGAAKLEGKRLDFLFANRVAKQGEALATGFSAETNGGILFRRDRDPVEIPTQPKAGVAKLIWNELGQTR
jgi:phosphopantothenoylcysteine decarboxylase/phosphopantothenate--cysteine ligase